MNVKNVENFTSKQVEDADFLFKILLNRQPRLSVTEAMEISVMTIDLGFERKQENTL